MDAHVSLLGAVSRASGREVKALGDWRGEHPQAAFEELEKEAQRRAMAGEKVASSLSSNDPFEGAVKGFESGSLRPSNSPTIMSCTPEQPPLCDHSIDLSHCEVQFKFSI